jgi:hypothetical protein
VFLVSVDDPGERSWVEDVEIVESRGGRQRFVELYAPQEERLAQRHADRPDAKRSKRNVEASWRLAA